MLKDKQPSSGVRAKANRFDRRAAFRRRAKANVVATHDDDVALVSRTLRGNGLCDDDAGQATSAEDVGEVVRDEFIDAELGGPFLEISARSDCSAWFTDPDEHKRVEPRDEAR